MLNDSMAENTPPRKQLRLLKGAKARVGSLFRRRKGSSRVSMKDESDAEFEDEQPILSRIADPAKLNQSLELKPKANSSRDDAFRKSLTYERSNTSNTKEPEGTRERERPVVKEDRALTGEKAVKAERRKGIICTADLTPAFESQHILFNNRVVAQQPTQATEIQNFTFRKNSNLSNTAHDNRTTQVGPQPVQDNAPLGVLQQAARNAFVDSSSQPEQVQEELFTPQKDGLTIQQFLTTQLDDNRNPCSTTNPIPAGLTADPNNQHRHRTTHQQQISKGPLEHLRLNLQQAVKPPQLDTPSPIAKVKTYIHPQVPFPTSETEIYRNHSHKAGYPSSLLDRTIPDPIESNKFVRDVEDDIAFSTTAESGGTSAWNSTKAHRVPVVAIAASQSDTCDLEADELFNHRETGISNLPLHSADAARRRDPRLRNQQLLYSNSVPENFYTAPLRLSTAYTAARRNMMLKRKRPSNPRALPPPSYIHQHTGNSAFNVFSNGILLYPELCLFLAAQLPVQTLINLYSLSKDFHVIINQRFTTIILNQARLKAPNAVRCYPWRCFNHLSQPDPSLKAGTTSLVEHISRTSSSLGGATINIKAPPTPQTFDASASETSGTYKTLYSRQRPHTRRVPTFRWIHFAIHREKVIHALYHVFAARGVPLPGMPYDTYRGSFCLTLHKLWFLFDIPDNTRRIAYVHSSTLMTDADLANILVFIVKLDMMCNCPLAAEKRDVVRKMLMSSIDGFDTILKVLQRGAWEDELQLLRAWARYGLQLDREDQRERAIGGGWVPLGLTTEEHAQSTTLFGIPRDEVGLLKREFWGRLEYDPITGKRCLPFKGVGTVKGLGRKPMYLMRPDQLALREAVKRGMTFSKQFLRGLLHGYVDEETLEAVPPRELNGGRSVVLEKEGEYTFDDAVAGVRSLSVEEGGDELLDLGDHGQGSKWTVKHESVGRMELLQRNREKELLSGYMARWRNEAEAARRRWNFEGFGFVS